MGGIRKFKRELIRNRCYRENGNTKSFGHDWRKYELSQRKKRRLDSLKRLEELELEDLEKRSNN